MDSERECPQLLGKKQSPAAEQKAESASQLKNAVNN
jgi:hypothetical protein